jgi:hypothetical protein
MNRSFKQGVFVGILAPLAFLAGIVYWVFRFTGQIPFPVRRPVEGELAIKLVDPVEVPAYWQHWKKELEPILDKYRALIEECKTRYASR